MLEPGDVPFQNGASCDFPTIPEDEADDYRKQSDRLLDEAITNKHGVIPTGAIVQQPFGPLRSFEIHEFKNRIGFVARDERGHFAVIYFWREDDGEWYFACENAVLFDDATARLNRGSAVALRYVLALIIRDFWILDQRELKRIFTDQNPKKVPGIRIRRKPDGTPRIVYLPKIVYSNSLPPRAAAKLDDFLNLTKRSKHWVRPHRRISSNSSQRARLLATRYGMPIGSGYTFVSPHQRGEQRAELIYRSRSALACLYKLQPGAAGQGGLQGIDFQWQIKEALERNGHEILILRNAIGGPDGGIDIHTLKDGIRWAFQAKHRRPDKKIDIDDIRIYSDSLRDWPEGIKPFFVTNTDYTKPAKDVARDRGIILWDGEQMQKMIACSFRRANLISLSRPTAISGNSGILTFKCVAVARHIFLPSLIPKTSSGTSGPLIA